MSESVETAPAEGAETPGEAVEPQVTEQAPEAAAEPQEPAKPEGKEPPWFMKRIDAMNRRNADLARELASLRAQQTELQAGRQLEPTEPKEPSKPETLSQQAIRAEAERMMAEHRFNDARQGVIQSGVKEFGAEDWNAKTQMIASMGATDNAAFMEALIDLPDAHKLVASLADDPDRLQSLLAKRPAAMAAEMGRMAAAMETAAPKPTLSKAPAPVKPISTRGTQAEPDPSKMSMKEFAEWRAKTAPKNLGGRGQRS